MKSILVIGLGRFGRHLCLKFMSLGNEVMIVDQNEEAVSALAGSVTSAQIADCTDEAVLAELGVRNFDLCFVCIGTNFASSLLITSLLKDMGARRVIAKASQDIHAKLLLRNGADEVVYPERDSAERMAVRLSAQNVFDYIELTDEYSIYEVPPLESWIGRSVRELDVRNRHHINILAVKQGDELRPMPGADYRFTGSEHILALAAKEDARKLLKRI
ncbi:MAG: TrkA family potassium uptake protein [Clostridia bacterium]|nr:TrkA family potassium uptake protein [Clostridia bacterium]